MFLFFYFSAVNAQINYTQLSNSFDLHIKQDTTSDFDVFTSIYYGKLSNTNEEGKPSLPVKYVNFIIPANKDIDDIVISTSNEIIFPLNSLIIPSQHPTPSSYCQSTPIFIHPDSSTYHSLVWPDNIAEYSGTSFFDHNNKIITIAIYPIQYSPINNFLKLFQRIQLTITLKNSENSVSQRIIHRAQNDIVMYETCLKSMVENSQDVNNYRDTLLFNNRIEQGQKAIPFYQYVIITDQSLVSAFSDFVEWKTRKGINIGVVTTQQIYNNYNTNTIDLYPINDLGVLDNAARIREYLKDAYFNGGTIYALLGGDMTYVPIRYGYAYNNSGS